MTTSRIPASSKRLETGGSAAAGGFEFQAKLGAMFGLLSLAQRPVDHSLGLGDAVPVWIRFESEAPVDDILVSTSQDGFIAVQAKTSVDLSSNSKGGLAQTVQQFVRHWLECRDGKGADGWNRTLDPARDRLVLAVGPSAPSYVRLDLPAALRSLSQPTPVTLNKDEARALEVFSSCVKAAWFATTSETMPADLLRQLAKLIRVITFDPDGTGQSGPRHDGGFGCGVSPCAPIDQHAGKPPPKLYQMPEVIARIQADAKAKQAECEAIYAAKLVEAQRDVDAAKIPGFTGESLRAEIEAKHVGPPTFTADGLRGQLVAIALDCRRNDTIIDEIEDMIANEKFYAEWKAAEANLFAAYRVMAHMQDPAPRMPPELAAPTRQRLCAAIAGREDLATLNFTGADLRGVDLRGADLSAALLESADLPKP